MLSILLPETHSNSDTKVIGVGFCWGGRWVNVLAAEEKIDVNVSVHASQTTDEMIDAIKSVPTIELMGDRDVSERVGFNISSAFFYYPLFTF